MDFHYHTAGLSRTSATSEVKFFVIIMRWSSAVGYRHKDSILDVSWVLSPLLYMKLTNENCTCFYKVYRFILEKINPWIQGINLTWIRPSKGVFRKSFDRLTNFQFTPCVHVSLRPVSSWNYYSYFIHYHK